MRAETPCSQQSSLILPQQIAFSRTHGSHSSWHCSWEQVKIRIFALIGDLMTIILCNNAIKINLVRKIYRFASWAEIKMKAYFTLSSQKSYFFTSQNKHHYCGPMFSRFFSSPSRIARNIQPTAIRFVSKYEFAASTTYRSHDNVLKNSLVPTTTSRKETNTNYSTVFYSAQFIQLFLWDNFVAQKKFPICRANYILRD